MAIFLILSQLSLLKPISLLLSFTIYTLCFSSLTICAMSRHWKDSEECPCLNQTNEQGTEMEPFSERVEHTK